MSQHAENIALAEQGPGKEQLFNVNQRFALTICALYTVDDPPNITQAQQDQALPGESEFLDGPQSLFSMYLNKAVREDREMVESWKADADNTLIFVGQTSPVLLHFFSV